MVIKLRVIDGYHVNFYEWQHMRLKVESTMLGYSMMLCGTVRCGMLPNVMLRYDKIV